jgi:hypothetical protein
MRPKQIRAITHGQHAKDRGEGLNKQNHTVTLNSMRE